MEEEIRYVPAGKYRMAGVEVVDACGNLLSASCSVVSGFKSAVYYVMYLKGRAITRGRLCVLCVCFYVRADMRAAWDRVSLRSLCRTCFLLP